MAQEAAANDAAKAAANDAVEEPEVEVNGQDIFYVCKKVLETLKEKLKNSEDVTQDQVKELTFPENLPDEEVMVPVDLRGVSEKFDDVEQLVEKLGPKAAAEAFVKAAEYFDANKDKEPEQDRPKPMSAAEWRKILEEDDDGQDIFYVCKKSLETLKEKLKKNEDITQDQVNELTFPENLPDDEIMVPVDMRGVGEKFDDAKQMVAKLGPKVTAEAFVKAAEYFDANKDKEPEEDRPKPMSAVEWRKVLEDEVNGQDISYVCKKSLETLKEKLKNNEDITQDQVKELTSPELPDDEIMVPVDMRGFGEKFDDVEQMVEKLGPKGTAEAFVKAAEYFDANKDEEPEEDRPKPMSAAEWRKVLEEDSEEAEEEDDPDAEEPEEDDLDGDAEELKDADGDKEAEGDAEPKAKKQKTG